MKTVNISPEENSIYRTFQEGHPVQVRVSVSPGDESEYDKGRRVRVVYQNEEVEGKIVSDPLEVEPQQEGGQKTLSLVLEKP
ncbi:hypothetical protein [Chryseosolibacter indicus]|uniref:Uncharacterized protein n=1 Tax=Chryseosolibacter indicus TaxID=2782351 RepID=A0ABS5VMU1_9BACT|nr:hypothetical protein [Chryseosolibacter indicus]MBT1702164.1 hypothetical protein [Chryseosolibacter indicus]